VKERSTVAQGLPFKDFVAYLEREVGLEVTADADDLVFGVDVELDSITMLEIVVAIEDLGAELPAELFLTATSLRQLYDAYVAALGDGKQLEGVA